MKFIRDFTNFARTLRLGRKNINFYFLHCDPIRVSPPLSSSVIGLGLFNGDFQTTNVIACNGKN